MTADNSQMTNDKKNVTADKWKLAGIRCSGIMTGYKSHVTFENLQVKFDNDISIIQLVYA